MKPKIACNGKNGNASKKAGSPERRKRENRQQDWPQRIKTNGCGKRHPRGCEAHVTHYKEEPSSHVPGLQFLPANARLIWMNPK